GELSGHLNIRNTFLDLEDAPSLAEQIRGLRRVSSCPVLESHREAHVEDNAQTVQTPVSPKSPLSEPHVQNQGKEQIDQTDQAAARTRLSSSAKMFQPKPVATVPAPSTTYFAAPPSRTYAMQGVQSQMLPSQPSMWAWSQQFQSLPGTCESPNQKGLLLSTASPSVSKPKVILGSAALPSVGSGGHATGKTGPSKAFSIRVTEALALVFAKALQLLVDCVHDSSLIETELEKISVMHCKFDLQAWHFEIFGQILLETLAEAGGQAWCNDYTEAWSMLYGMASQTFLEAIDSSRTSLCSALLQGSTKKVKEALSKAPRGERAASALQVGVGRRQLSPLLWALRDMHLEVLEILLSDILTIRADRQCFYYGVDDLWKRCPAILDALVEFAPHLLEPLLDGHMWVSRETTDGLRRVNLWVQYIYGNPEELEHVFAGPLGTLVERLPETHIEVFRHPVIAETVNLKWHQFGRRRLIAVSVQQITCLISYLVVSMSGDLSLWLRLCACALWGTITAIQLAHGCYIATWEACTQRCTSLDFKLCRLKVPRSLCQFFVQLRLVCCLLSLLLIETMVVNCFYSSSDARCLEGDHASPRVLSASVAFLQWIQMAELFKLHGKMAAVVLLGKAMMEDALRFMMGLGLWLIAVGASLHKLQDDETRPQNGFSSAYNLFAHVLGVGTDTDLTYYESSEAFDTVVRIVYLGALWVSVVPILNVLIAAMVSTYSKAESMTLGLAIKARAGFVLRMEDMLRFKRRLHFFKDAGFDTALAFSEHDRGPSGGISMMCDTLQLKEHGSFGRRVGAVLFFSGETGTDQPWPSHDIPLLVNHVNTVSEKLHSQELHRELLSELRVIRDATSRARAASASREPVAAPPVEVTLQTLAAVAEASTGQHCFLAVEGRIYDVGAYLPNHPGGSSVLTSGRGKDVSELFRAAHPQLVRAREALAQLPVLGILSNGDAPAESAVTKIFV
ncbi:fadA, partial [Symbiodinium necroappetens]